MAKKRLGGLGRRKLQKLERLSRLSRIIVEQEQKLPLAEW